MNDKKRIVLTFILGFILGGAIVFTGIHFCRHYRLNRALWAHHGGFDSKESLKKLSKNLDLNAEQKVEVEKILAAYLPKFKELRESVRPQFTAIRESMQNEIRNILKPEQRTKFNKMVEDFENSRKKWKEKMDRDK